ncbi:hypothetical protein BOG92_051340 [Streptomyces sp. WAC00263]|nr:hypothetical protein BOG92_051340 [Streptomyces sp. WAC00263]
MGRQRFARRGWCGAFFAAGEASHEGADGQAGFRWVPERSVQVEGVLIALSAYTFICSTEYR